jgi:putative tryptophan/tyrosine transport system substrate-binding protein
MNRREFIAGLGCAAAWPLAARAQQPGQPPMVGFLDAASANPRSGPAFRKGLSETGFVEGHNVFIEYRAANNDYGRLPELAADLVRHRVAAIYANGGAITARAAKAATSTVPIVFAMGDDPVADGLVASFNRPGGNVTGIAFLSSELGSKRLGLLKDLIPTAMHYAVLVNPGNPSTERVIAELRAAAHTLGKKG